jgi:hypothetical protein
MMSPDDDRQVALNAQVRLRPCGDLLSYTPARILIGLHVADHHIELSSSILSTMDAVMISFVQLGPHDCFFCDKNKTPTMSNSISSKYSVRLDHSSADRLGTKNHFMMFSWTIVPNTTQ